MPLLALQIRLLSIWEQARTHMTATVADARNDSGDLAPSVIYMVALAVAAAAAAVVVVAKINTHIAKIP